MAIRSSILVVTLILIGLHIANFGIFFYDEKSEKEEVRLESMLTEPYIQSSTPINDTLEVGFTYHVL